MIVPMKKAKLVVLQEDKEKLLKSLQKASVLMLITNDEVSSEDSSNEEAILQRTEQSLKLIKKYREKDSFIRQRTIVSETDFHQLDSRQVETLAEIEDVQTLISTLEGENERLQEEISYYLPWKDLNIKLSDFTSLRQVVFHTGFIEPRKLDDLKLLLLESGSEINLLGLAPDGQALVYANYIGDDLHVQELVKAMGFNEISLPKNNRFVSEIIKEKEEQVDANLKRIEELENKLREFAEDANRLELLNDQIASLRELKTAPVRLTLETAYLEGWLRNDQIDVLEKAIKKATQVYDLEIVEPREDEVSPTYTKNNRFVSAFEAVTNMFSRPQPGEVDPNPAMSIWFWFIFGMMMGDVGYGILMFVIFFALIKIKKPKGESIKLYKLLLYSSITTVFWGVMFGSYFGYSLWKPVLLDPISDMQTLLVISLVVGALHVITGILVGAYNNIIQGKWLDAIFDQFSWVILIVGAGLIFVPSLNRVGIALAITGAVIILFTAGRAKKNIFSKLLGGLGSLYGATGYASDILSYSRILALSLSTAVIGMVMNILAEMVMGSFIGYIAAAAIYLVGHLFNLVMGLLSAYVHDSRLQYIEFFGKFYEGGGYPFAPLSYNLKYIDEVNEKVEIKQEVL